ncbi:MAG: adenine deaminase, partial [Firmicutes bacterium]|nr:adenine deaminase [Bacillota bacterium]
MCRLGIDPLVALRMVTLSPAEYFMLPRRGGIAPGWIADMALVDSLESCRVDEVWHKGKLVATRGRLCQQTNRDFPLEKMLLPPPASADDLRIAAIPGKQKIRVIGWQEGSLLTDSLSLTPRIEQGIVVADPGRDIAKLVVQERNRHTGKISVGFVNGLGLRAGALGASMAHDAHPFIVAGGDDQSILRALAWLRENGGGFVACEGDRVLAALQLPIGGLMSEASLAEVAQGLDAVDQAAAGLGLTGAHPCMALSFLSLSVIPSLKLTDQGYADIGRGGRQELFAD